MTTIDEYTLTIEETAVRRFGEASWDASTRFSSQGGVAAMEVPPIYLCCAATLSGRENTLRKVNFDVSRSFHGTESVEVRRHLKVGETLRVHEKLEELPGVTGKRAGTMRRVRRETTFTDRDDLTVAVTTRVLLEAESALTVAAPVSDVHAFDDGLQVHPDPLPYEPKKITGLGVGDLMPATRFGPLTRTDFVRYAAASGDLTAIHFDENAAKSRGYPTVFAMGMLSGAFLAHAFTDWVELVVPWRLSLRFVDLVWPGETLDVSGSVRTADAEGAVLEAVCSSNGRTVTTGTIEVGQV
jgi:acyl dehydratase